MPKQQSPNQLLYQMLVILCTYSVFVVWINSQDILYHEKYARMDNISDAFVVVKVHNIKARTLLRSRYSYLSILEYHDFSVHEVALTF